MLFNLKFATNTTLSGFFFCFLIIDLCFLIPAAIAQISNHTAELIIPIGISRKEARAEIEIHPVTADVVQEGVQYNLELHKPFYPFYSSMHFAVFLQGNNFLFHLYF